jgi:hypothetical protein
LLDFLNVPVKILEFWILPYVTRCIAFPSFFLTECGFSMAVGFCVAVGLQGASSIEELLGQRYYQRIRQMLPPPTEAEFQDGCRVYSLFTCFALYLVEFLEALSKGGKETTNCFAILMACLPRKNEKLLGFTLALVFEIAEDLNGRNKVLSNLMRKSLAIVLGANYRRIFNPRQNRLPDDITWASGNPQECFRAPPENVTADEIVSPTDLIGRLESVIVVKQGIVLIGELMEKANFSGELRLARPYLEYVGGLRAPIVCRL